MLFKNYLEAMNELAKNSPETLEMPCIYSRDDEGNGFQEVDFEASQENFMIDGREIDQIHPDDFEEYDSEDIVKGILIN